MSGARVWGAMTDESPSDMPDMPEDKNSRRSAADRRGEKRGGAQEGGQGAKRRQRRPPPSDPLRDALRRILRPPRTKDPRTREGPARARSSSVAPDITSIRVFRLHKVGFDEVRYSVSTKRRIRPHWEVFAMLVALAKAVLEDLERPRRREPEPSGS